MLLPSKSKHAGRTTHIEAILGRELCARLPQTKVLLVGAGGIGCELRKYTLWCLHVDFLVMPVVIHFRMRLILIWTTIAVKNIVMAGFGQITLLDLDTIDLSNLNRQFLFKKKDVKQSKAMIAAQTAAPFNPNVHIHPIHGNIKEAQFDIAWFEEFDIVLNALDNLGMFATTALSDCWQRYLTLVQMRVDMSTKCAWLLKSLL